MKKILFFIVLLSGGTLLSQTDVIINGGLENWTEGLVDSWVTENSVTQNTMDFEEGTSSGLFAITDNTMRPKIISQVPMKANIEYTILYKYRYIDANFNGSHPISLQISRAGSASTLSSNRFAQNNDWTEVENTFTPDIDGDYDLSISLGTFDDDPFNVLIDDIRVIEPVALSVTEVAAILKNKVNVFPTVATDFINIDADADIDIKQVSIYDIKGVKSDIAQANFNQLNISNLSRGIYLLAINTNKGDMTLKIVKE
ncbi:hypothetical protein GCM10022393_14750 [Aquimarina addita]|uniref:Secretion system C-terminal sorting domain-containing protein n=1 Tax=Aquimarina addita TaxID=870485 RepID=A0ABP7XFS0_9FLAO